MLYGFAGREQRVHLLQPSQPAIGKTSTEAPIGILFALRSSKEVTPVNFLEMTQEPPKRAGEERGSTDRSCGYDQKQDGHRDSHHLS
jgi:hypothetical protein